ncbi:hypothetical protein BC834DRAFT_976013 [Gloeopeniophorella convolvens]|nr:hypothetical protein BC834DRAFT_976013 [Gloeopeniophorella convolvens]
MSITHVAVYRSSKKHHKRAPETPLSTIFEEPFAGAPPAEPPSLTEELPVIVTHASRRMRHTWQVEDVLLDVPGAEPELETPTDADNMGAGPIRSTTRRIVCLLVTDPMRTALDKFALRRFYKRRPVHTQAPELDLATQYTPTADTATARKSHCSIKDIIAPYPNLSSWLFGHHYWLNFIPSDIARVNFKNINAKLSSAEGTMPWDIDRDGWKESSISINMPLTEKSTQSSRRAQVNDVRRFACHEFHKSIPPSQPREGVPFIVPSFWHRSLCAEIWKTLTTDPAACDFVFDPFHLEFHDPLQDGKVEHVYGELYNSDAFAIMGLELWSDATQLAHFAHQKTWPVYMYFGNHFGNQLKYERARPTSKAAHHVAYFPVLPDNIHDFIKKNNGGKPTSSKVLTHCWRKLFQGGLELLFDDEFVHAYKHGMVVDSDYLEK